MIEILRGRRSVRQFTDQVIEYNKLEILKEALLLAPTSRNIEPCEFVIVRDKEMLKKLSKLKPHGAAFLAECDTAFVICGDTLKSDVCVEDCSIASITLQYTAESLGLGSCWVQARERDHSGDIKSEQYVRDLLGMPANIMVVSVVAMGYPSAKKEPRAKRPSKRAKYMAKDSEKPDIGAKCTGCGACISACPEKAIEFSTINYIKKAGIIKQLCTGCRNCIDKCPFGTIA